MDNGHWMWRVIDSNIKDMLNGRDHYVFAFDESITLGHKIKDRETLIGYMRTMDPISFRLEYKNRRTGEKQMIAKDQLLDFLKGQIKA